MECSKTLLENQPLPLSKTNARPNAASCLTVATGAPLRSKSPWHATALVALLYLGVVEPRAQAAVEVVPFRVEESRVVAFSDDKVSRTPASLRLTLSLKGPEAESCVCYGNLKLEQATDDKGTDLVPTKDTFHNSTKFKEYSNTLFRNSKFLVKDHPTAPQVEIDLGVPVRSASKIARLRGSIELADKGSERIIELAALKGAGKKSLEMPSGAKVGITATVAPGDNIRSISLEVTGDEDAVESMEVVDGSGKKVSNGLSSWSLNGGPAQKSLGLKQPLDDSMKLVVKVITDRKVIKVPFDLKDIALP